MDTIKAPAKSAILVWKVRIFVIAVLSFLASIVLLYMFGPISILFPLIALSVLLFFAYYFVPKFFSSFTCTVSNAELSIYWNALFIRKESIPFRCIQFAQLKSTPLERAYNLSSVTIYLAGAKVTLHCLFKEDAVKLYQLLNGKRGACNDN